jgi:hypothetical protein
MLSVDWRSGRIPSDYDDDYLELLRLLIEGAGLEHSLMLAYLYSLFSLKERHTKVGGDITKYAYLEHSPIGHSGTEALRKYDTFLDVALEEMQHLAMVNWFLVELGASPNLSPHTSPLASDIYPFEIELRPLDRYTAATFLWVEADECKLTDGKPSKELSESPSFILEVRKVLQEGSRRYRELAVDQEPINHIGSLYNKIVCQTQRVADACPKFLPDNFPWAVWEDRMNWILYQGEMSHYQFFRRVFTGEAFGGDRLIWEAGPDYPSYSPFQRQTAYRGHPNTIKNSNVRRLAWLADLHYWTILCLLDTAYRARARKFCYKAIDGMTQGLWHLGHHLAEHYQTGLPFDPMGPYYFLGRSPQMSLQILRRLVIEAKCKADEIDKHKLLPRRYDPHLHAITLAGLEQLFSPGCLPPDEPEFRFA